MTEKEKLEQFSAGRPEALREEEEMRLREQKRGGFRVFASGGQSDPPQASEHTEPPEKQSNAMERFSEKVKDMKEKEQEQIKTKGQPHDKGGHER